MNVAEKFEAFWKSYPNKKGKADARKAFDKAIKLVTLETMLAAISAYVANKPDWQGYKHPATWLRAGSWDDEWEPQQAKAPVRQETRAEFIARSIQANDWDKKPSADPRINNIIKMAVSK